MATVIPEPNAFAHAAAEKQAVTRNLAKCPGASIPGHFGQALSKAIVTTPETSAALLRPPHLVLRGPALTWRPTPTRCRSRSTTSYVAKAS